MDFVSDILIPVASLAGLGLIFGALLAVANKVFMVKVDKRVADISEVLPGINCGACGYPSCSAFAEAVAAGKAPVNGCVPGRAEVAEKVGDIMGVEAEADERFVAKLACRGTEDVARDKLEYYGAADCRSAMLIEGGPKACAYGCMGLGTCVEVCPFGAITMGEEGLPLFEDELCNGCRRCFKACPKDVIRMVSVNAEVDVACNNHDKGAAVLKACKVGCIACGKCVKVCPEDAIEMVDNLAVIDYHKCTNCGACIEACPTNAIVRLSPVI